MNRCDSYFEKIFKNNYSEVYSFLLKKLGSSDDASDTAQDTFLRMAKCCGQTNISSPKSYLYRIARNIATDLLRSRASRSRHLDTADIEAQPSSLPSPEDRKSTRLNSSHLCISYAVFCLKKKK